MQLALGHRGKAAVVRSTRGRCDTCTVRFLPKGWHAETWVCSMRGHAAPALRVERLRPEDRELGIDTHDGRRLARCLRCDVWVEGLPPADGQASSEFVPPLSELDLPRRGQPLSDAILLRLIAIDRGVHAVVFGLLALVLFVVDTKLFDLHTFARGAAERLDGVVYGSRAPNGLLSTELHRLADLERSTITVLAVTATVYCVIEGLEAVGLWLERRWAEYLTVVATAGFLPFEIRELLEHVTVVRIGALVVNLVILAYLVYAKRLFGVRGGAAALHDQIDWDAVLTPPVVSDSRPPHATPTR